MTDLYYLIPIGMLVGTNVAAIVSWRKTWRARNIARDAAAHHEFERSITQAAYCGSSEAYFRAMTKLDAANLARMELEDRLASIESQRHLSAKHARAAQIAQRAAKVAATANELRREAAVKRLAA